MGKYRYTAANVAPGCAASLVVQSATVIRKTLLLSALIGLALPIACDSDDDDDMGTGAGTGDSDGVPADFAGKTNPLDGDSGAIASGMAQYTQLCANCHGDTGAGDGPGSTTTPPATDFTAMSNADDFMLWSITEGVSGTAMASYSGMSETEIWQLISYIRTLQ